MTTQKEKNNRDSKKYLVFGLMILAFLGFLWLIFAPSQSEEDPEGTNGINTEIPEPSNVEIVGDKKTAYEQEQIRLKQEERMRTLQDYSFDLLSTDDNPSDNADLLPSSAIREQKATSPIRQQKSSFEASNYAYQDINRTLGHFYQEPKEDIEKDKLREEIAELKKIISEQAITPSYDEQLALMEKSYQLASKYLPGDHNREAEEDTTISTTIGKSKGVPVGRVTSEVVSSLTEPNLQATSHFINTGFNTAVGERKSISKNTVRACIHDNQTILNGQSVRIRIQEDMKVGSVILPRNTLLTGMGKIQGERLEISIVSIEYNGSIFPVDLAVYDTDGQRGIFIPNSSEINAAKDIAANLGQNLGTSVSISNQSAGDQLLSELGKGAIQGASQYITKKIREVKVHLKAGYILLLMQNE